VKVPVSRFQGKISGIEAQVEGELEQWYELKDAAKGICSGLPRTQNYRG
jgi:hypothetical protein